MKKKLLALALVAMVAPIAAHATQENGIGYTYAQLDYVNQSQSWHNSVADGAMLSGSYGFADNFQIFGSYTDASFSNPYIRGVLDRFLAPYGLRTTDIDGLHTSGKNKPWSLGFGYAKSIGERADWVTQLSYTHDRVSFRGCLDGWGCESMHDSRDIFAVNTGVMGRITDNLTANAYIGYSNGGKYVSGNMFGDFGMVYSFNKTWALHGGVLVNNDTTETFSLGARASF